jgi:hypothetical protein
VNCGDVIQRWMELWGTRFARFGKWIAKLSVRFAKFCKWIGKKIVSLFKRKPKGGKTDVGQK